MTEKLLADTLSLKTNTQTKLLEVFETRQEKTGFYLCETKETDQLCSKYTADQCLCFYSTLLLTSEFSSLYFVLWLYSPSCVGAGRKPRRPFF